MEDSIRKKWIDNAKGIAMLCVIVGHVSGGLEKPWNFQFVYGFHLVMFFLLSGYTLNKRTFDRKYVNAKFTRLMVPYFYTCAAIIIMDVLNCYIINHDDSIATVTDVVGRDLLRGFFASGAYTTFGSIELGTRIGAIWFLPAMFFAVIFFQGLLQFVNDRLKRGIVTLFLALIGFISAKFIWLPFSIQSGMMAVFFIWIGYEIKESHILDKIKWYHYLIALFIFVAGIHGNYSNVGFVVADTNDIIISTVVGLCGCMIIYLIATHMERSVLIAHIGRYSLTVLCVHLFTLETLGDYVNKCVDLFGLNGNNRTWLLIFIEITVAVGGAFIIESVKSKLQSIYNVLLKFEDRRHNLSEVKRDIAIDVARGIFIISMLIGHFDIDGRLRNIIYSCHMIAFIFFSGYFYKKEENIFKSIVHMCKALLVPYMVCVTGIIILNFKRWSPEFFLNVFKQYAIGMSFSRRYFINVESVGPIYFILLLFIVRLIYLCLNKIVKNDRYRTLVVFGISVIGMKLGQADYWLPWSIDVACYALVFYQLGLCVKKYNILEFVKNNHISYFILTPIWAYMIYLGGMEIAIRNYGQYGLTIMGALAGVLVLYKFSVYIVERLPIISELLVNVGKYSVIVLVIHTMLGEAICKFVIDILRVHDISYLVLSCVIQVLLALLFAFFMSIVKKLFGNAKISIN